MDDLFIYINNQPAPAEKEKIHLPDIERKDLDLPPLPEGFRIRRGFRTARQEFGPYSAHQVAEYLASGALLPDDYSFASNGQWQQLQTTGLT